MTETAFRKSFWGVTQAYKYQNDLVHSSRLRGLVVCHNMGHSYYCMLSDAEFIDCSQLPEFIYIQNMMLSPETVWQLLVL